MIHRHNPDWGTHIPILLKCLGRTKGPVLELGLGISSTPLLHALCEDQNRLLYSYESDPTFVKLFSKYDNGLHKIRLKDWDNTEYGSWDVVLVDLKPEEKRTQEIRKLKDLAQYIIIHDSEQNLYHYDDIYPLFKYRYDYTKTKVHTTVLSNFHDLSFLHHSEPK